MAERECPICMINKPLFIKIHETEHECCGDCFAGICATGALFCPFCRAPMKIPNELLIALMYRESQKILNAAPLPIQWSRRYAFGLFMFFFVLAWFGLVLHEAWVVYEQRHLIGNIFDEKYKEIIRELITAQGMKDVSGVQGPPGIPGPVGVQGPPGVCLDAESIQKVDQILNKIVE